MKINLIITSNDIDKVAKIVFYDNKERILMLKRSSYVKKHANSWDLPGGHLKEDENLIQGLRREVKEETGIENFDATFFKQIKDKYFYFANIKPEEHRIRISYEHTDFSFFNKLELDQEDEFQKIAIKVLEHMKNDQT